MNLIKLAYKGSKAFKDKRHGSHAVWNTGDTKHVTDTAARKLLKYCEFSLVDGDTGAVKAADKPADPYEAAALAKLQEVEAAQQNVDSEKESMLLHISNWDKDQLKTYATKYEVNLNKTRGLQSLRDEVAGLVNMFGVR